MKELFKTEKITERITRIWMPGKVFTYLVKGDRSAMVIDTGCGLGAFREYVESLLAGMPYEVLLTHGHLDHAGGAIQFLRVWLNEADWNMAATNSKEARGAYLRGNGADCFEDAELDAPKEDGYLPVQYGQIFDLGGEELEIVNFAGHSAGSIGILFKEERILLTGDACCSWALLLGGSGNGAVRAYEETLKEAWEKYQNCMDDMLYSHPHNYGGPEVIPQMIDVCEDILAGKDDHLTTDLFGRVAFLAKEADENTRRVDGKIANLVYTME